MPTSNFNTMQLLKEEILLKLTSLTNSDAIKMDLIATNLGNQRGFPITVQVRIGERIVYHGLLEGSKPENDWWINRKVTVLLLKQIQLCMK
jgi:uncharacterized protein (UPF0303 family)